MLIEMVPPEREDEPMCEDNGADEFFRSYTSKSCRYVPRRGFRRYSEALKVLLPYRTGQKKENVIEVDSAGFFSFALFSWLSKYIYLAHKKGLSFDDIPSCSPHESGDPNAQRLGMIWQAELDRRGPENASLGRAVWKFLQTRILLSSFIYVLNCMLGFISPAIFMRKLIEYCANAEADITDGLTWALAFTISELLRMLLMALYHSMSNRTATRLRAACLVLIFKKIMHLQTLGSKSIGEVINMYGSDGGRLFYLVVFGPLVLGGPIAVVCTASYTYILLGKWALLGLFILIFYYPIQYLLSRLSGYFRELSIRKTDERIRLITELLNSIKSIKMCAWDVCFKKRIQEVRNEELSLLQKGNYCQSLGTTLPMTIPGIAGILIIIIHVLTGGNITAAQAFPLITILYSQLRVSLLNLKYGTENIIDGQITFGRIQEMLLLEEMPPPVKQPSDKTMALTVNEGFFVWNDPGEISKNTVGGKKERNISNENLYDNTNMQYFILESINLYVTKGSLIGICGAVGSGKSSLLHACLSQMKKLSGEIHRDGSCAVVSQEAWIENATLKENILFGEPFDPKKYIDTLYCCSLNEDVTALPAGDDTEIGDHGVNLSGGQKQRVALARALYANRDIYFLDDPLSAVDSQVAVHIFEKCILNALKRKTVLLITHQTKFLQNCEEILVMKDGRIVERGTHYELLSIGREYKNMVESTMLVASHRSEENCREKNEEYDKKDMTRMNGLERTSNSSPPKKYPHREEQVRGTVKTSIYQTYIKAAGGYFISFWVLMFIFLNVGSNCYSTWWLAVWLKDGSGNTTIVNPSSNETIISPYINDNPYLRFYIEIYAWIIGAICASSLLQGLSFTRIAIRASRILHNNYLEKLISGRLRFFEVTPIGQIQNIFSKDFEEIDFRLPITIVTLCQNIWVIFFSFLFITLIFPWFLVILLIIGVFYYIVGNTFRVAIRDLKRIEALTRAPVFSFLTATINGLPIIHAFNKEREYLSQFYQRYDEYSVCCYMSSCAMRWMATRLDIISVAVVFTTSTLVLLLKGGVAPALAGLALSYSCRISGIFQYTLRLMSETEMKFISVERILHSTRKIVTESNPKRTIEVSANWPSQGNIKFDNVGMSYSKDLPSVLDRITFEVKGGEKIGIVGRTGAGKSSLIAAIFRLVELSQGTISIDGIDISLIRLDELRSRISVIPQDSVIFNGTLRFNLDPFGKYNDATIWEALRQVKLTTKIKSMVNGLSTKVGEGGENFSVGESQLLCLARALLHESKILILDEATASVDPDTETIVQNTIDEHFSDCTILTIAHRLQSIKNCGKVLVVDKGVVQEFDEPDKLLNNPDALFTRMAKVLK